MTPFRPGLLAVAAREVHWISPRPRRAVSAVRRARNRFRRARVHVQPRGCARTWRCRCRYGQFSDLTAVRPDGAAAPGIAVTERADHLVQRQARSALDAPSRQCIYRPSSGKICWQAVPHASSHSPTRSFLPRGIMPRRAFAMAFRPRPRLARRATGHRATAQSRAPGSWPKSMCCRIRR